MRVSTAIALALTALLATSLFGAVAATPAVAASGPEQTQTAPVDDRPLIDSASTTLSQTSATAPTLTATQPALDDTDPDQVIRISVGDTGDAQWTIESRFLLTDDDDEEAFTEYADEVTSGQRDAVYDVQQFEPFRQDAQQATDREMSLENAGWDEPQIVSPEDAGLSEQQLPETDEDSSVRVGVITYSFTWTNFATIDEDRIYFGDAFETESGVWFSLTDTQRLVVESPSNFALETPTSLEWTGPHEFSDDELQIVFVRSAGAGGGVAPPPAMSEWLIAGVVGLMFAVGIGSYLLARRPQVELPPPADRLRERVMALGIVRRLRPRTGDDQSHPESGTTDTDGGSFETATGPVDSAPPGGAGTQLEFEEEFDDGVDPELLSDEERVLRLLKQNSGRMKQGSIVSETGWSNAKVSQLLSQMDEDDEIEKLRIGRENLITLPDVDPTEIN
ncbi:helix-turn-helix transcriptional regulator [Natronorubrum bangense]|uniref:HTH iclR-type domain-containing protein n=1 Tax=Natronorubrum bangense JCM 10635 TaxID=1227500 RepID=L9WGD6_9EURY|nr:hypothetical protein [Natronorubrum bangense]ELY48494.1 hypothetical protein C494_10785 [Natronorubrum bangense JCM 10635]